MARPKFTKSDFAALNRKIAGVRYPPGASRAQLRAGKRTRHLRAREGS